MKKYLTFNRYVFLPGLACLLVCLVLNASIVKFSNISISVDQKITGSAIANFVEVLNLPTNIISAMVLQMLEKAEGQNKSQEDNNKSQTLFDDVICTGLTTSDTKITELRKQNSKVVNSIFYTTSNYLIINYLINIQLWRCIVFVLLFRMLFNVLPRSVPEMKLSYILKSSLYFVVKKYKLFLFLEG